MEAGVGRGTTIFFCLALLSDGTKLRSLSSHSKKNQTRPHMFYSFNNIGYNKWDRKALLSLFTFKTLLFPRCSKLDEIKRN